MKNNGKRKLTLDKETLSKVTGGGPFTTGLVLQTIQPCVAITGGLANTCWLWGCQTDFTR